MATSYYDWSSILPQHGFGEVERMVDSFLPAAAQTELELQLVAPELLAFYNNPMFNDVCTDPLMELNQQAFGPESCSHGLFPSFSDQYFPPLEEFEPCHCYSKRHKSYKHREDHVNCYQYFDAKHPDQLLGFGCCDYQMPMFDEYLRMPVYGDGGGDVAGVVEANEKKQNGNGGGGGSLSAQSVAARQRRRKITEKTQQLAKLIPGANKMNTADMFQAASKYVRFLQAQLAVLQTLDNFVQDKEVAEMPELQLLLTSPSVQEKLYSEEKCLVTEQFVKNVLNSRKITSNTTILKGINGLIQGEHCDAD